MIDEIYGNAPAVVKAIDNLTWHNARVRDLFIGYEDHGILTVSISFEGQCWVQGFHNRSLVEGDSFKNFVEGWLKILPVENCKGKLVRVGKDGDLFNSDLVAVRPIINSNPVFWPGGDVDKFYVFDCVGEVMKRGRS